MDKVKALEQLMTEANEAAKALAGIASDAVYVRAELYVTQYKAELTKLVAQFETDATGRLLASEVNAAIEAQIATLNGQFTTAMAELAGTEAEIMGVGAAAVEKTVADAASTVGRIAATDAAESVIASASAEASQLGTQMLKASYEVSAKNLTLSVEVIVRNAVERVAGTKPELLGKLFGERSLEEWDKRIAQQLKQVDALDKNLGKYIEDIRNPDVDVAKIRDKLTKDVADYKQLRKEQYEQLKAEGVIDKAKISERMGENTQREILNTHQDAVHREAEAKFGAPEKILYVNAKNTSFADNCVDAMGMEPMTLTDWDDSDVGAPRSDKRDCSQWCRCILYPVGAVGDKALPEDGTGLSEVQP